mmetsp:Transcript_70651/g.155860  ORF Transcript_70651/g.155860 Transcript_70651/m.155860 type:complete len:146 (-) Transcript_70651:106-543(-)
MAGRAIAWLLLAGSLCILLRTALNFVASPTKPGSQTRLALHARGGDEGPELVEQLLKPDVVLLDVRTAEEYADGHVDGSVNIPHTQIEARAAELPEDSSTPVVVFCAKGIRAQMAQGVLAKLGYANVVNGMTWIQVQETIDQLPQ